MKINWKMPLFVGLFGIIAIFLSVRGVSYATFHKSIETKTHFYLMISFTKGYIIVKENCS